jgi:hypothetical protein
MQISREVLQNIEKNRLKQTALLTPAEKKQLVWKISPRLFY